MFGITTISSTAPPLEAWTTLIFYDGSNNPQYLCKAQSYQPTYTVSATNVVVLTNVGTVNATAHGLAVGNSVTLAGSATAALNGTYVIATVPNANSFTIATSGVGDATYTDATITTNAPSTAQAIWAIQQTYYSGASPSRIAWAEGSSATKFIADNRATYAYL